MRKALLTIIVGAGLVSTYIFVFHKEKDDPVIVQQYEVDEQRLPGMPEGKPDEKQIISAINTVTENQVAENNSEKQVREKVMPEMDAETLEDMYERVNNNSDYPTLESKLREVHGRRPGSNFSDSKLVNAMQKSSAWERLDEKPENVKVAEKRKFYDTEYIRFDRLKVETLSVGDTMEIPIVHTGETYIMKVDEVEMQINGNITWRGKYSHGGQNFHVSFTQNNSGLTVGGMNTPNGHYTIEAHNDVGWVTSSNAGIKDSMEPDFIVPNIE